MNSMRLSVLGFGLALGVTCAIFMFGMALVAMYWGIGAATVQSAAAVYYGYAATWIGAVYGAVGGFIKSFIWGIVAAYLYNYFSAKVSK